MSDVLKNDIIARAASVFGPGFAEIIHSVLLTYRRRPSGTRLSLISPSGLLQLKLLLYLGISTLALRVCLAGMAGFALDPPKPKLQH